MPVRNALEWPRTGGEDCVEKIEASQHVDAGRHESLSARLVPGEAGTIENADVMAGAGQEQRRGGATRTRSDNYRRTIQHGSAS